MSWRFVGSDHILVQVSYLAYLAIAKKRALSEKIMVGYWKPSLRTALISAAMLRVVYLL